MRASPRCSSLCISARVSVSSTATFSCACALNEWTSRQAAPTASMRVCRGIGVPKSRAEARLCIIQPAWAPRPMNRGRVAQREAEQDHQPATGVDSEPTGKFCKLYKNQLGFFALVCAHARGQAAVDGAEPWPRVQPGVLRGLPLRAAAGL